MSTVYPRRDGDASDPIGQTAPIETGKLADGTNVAVIETTERYYFERRSGYDPGTWEHALCLHLEEDRFIIASTHLATGAEKVAYAHSAIDWKSQIPTCQSHLFKEAKRPRGGENLSKRKHHS